MSFGLLITIGVLFGVGFGFCVQRAGLCFAHGLGEIYLGRGKRITRMFLIIFVITSLGFVASAYVVPNAGLKPIGQLRGYGLFNVLSGMLFGAGIALCGGCILGTLRQLGEGNLTFLVVLVSFIPGLAFAHYVLNPMLKHAYHTQRLVLPELLNVSAPYVTAVLVVGALVWLYTVRRRTG
jgi:uncharacterized membrane protein YedE/YeeE